MTPTDRVTITSGAASAVARGDAKGLVAATTGARWIGLALALVAMAPASAVADDARALDGDTARLEVEGQADAGDADARTRAVDRGFAAAVEQTLDRLVTADVRKQNRRLLRRNLVRKARRFIASYKVLHEGQEDGKVRVRIAATVDLRKLRDALAELGIDAAADPVGSSGGDARGRARPRIVVLYHGSNGNRVEATFGRSAGDGGAGGRALAAALRAQGFDVVSAARVEIPVSREAPVGLPLGDDAAARVARDVGAGGAVVVGLAARGDGPIRGTAMTGALGRASVRVLDVTRGGAVVASGTIGSAAFAESETAALAAASARTATRLARAVLGKLTEYWPSAAGGLEPELGDASAVVVTVRGYQGWQSVDALVRQLAKTRGVARVWPLQLGRLGVALAIETSLDERRLIAAIRRADMPTANRVSVQRQGERRLAVEIRGEGEGAQ